MRYVQLGDGAIVDAVEVGGDFVAVGKDGVSAGVFNSWVSPLVLPVRICLLRDPYAWNIICV